MVVINCDICPWFLPCSSQNCPCDCLTVGSPSREPSGQLGPSPPATTSSREINEAQGNGFSANSATSAPSPLTLTNSGGFGNPPKSVPMCVDGHRSMVMLTSESIHISYKPNKWGRRCLMTRVDNEDGMCLIASSHL